MPVFGCSYFDRYMEAGAEKAPRQNLQLVGVTAMIIVSKYEGMYAPEKGDFVYITDMTRRILNLRFTNKKSR